MCKNVHGADNDGGDNRHAERLDERIDNYSSCALKKVIIAVKFSPPYFYRSENICGKTVYTYDAVMMAETTGMPSGLTTIQDVPSRTRCRKFFPAYFCRNRNICGRILHHRGRF